ncbi:cytochrome P450 [Streptomyces qinzhouensis]|uniref:Cytochrome P450 n=1 Tax=Streptomyces qinzhouensis TaxID=2599401 RepID=A0A5B8ICJ5_9ACTN|nr:cytochrome P450 [Streptomyces qinzhouensis]QDY75572.1 cytochrome P450 [Streptomyces qinzhouensis]
MSTETLFRRITDYAARPDPYPLYAELREHGVARQEDGSYLVGTYDEVVQLLHDPRISSDAHSRADVDEELLRAEADGMTPAFIGLDDPEHERLRGIAMRPFGPPHSPGRIDALQDDIARIAQELIDGFDGREEVDLVDDFAYPLPVTVIGRLLGIPSGDMGQLRRWTDIVIASLDFDPGEDPAVKRRRGREAGREMADYLGDLAASRRDHPSDDLLSALVGDPGPEGAFRHEELKSTAALLLIAGHETTVNLITNGALTLMRHPEAAARLRNDPGLMPSAVEELLRYEPPVQLLPQRSPLTDIEVAGVTVPRGAPLILVLAAANRDPLRFPEPDRFDPARRDNQHLGFGSGIHSCFGAPLARVEARIALTALLARIGADAHPVEDPPPYRRSPVLRGPRHLLVRH